MSAQGEHFFLRLVQTKNRAEPSLKARID